MTLRGPVRFLVTVFLLLVILAGALYWVGTRTGLVEQQVNAWLDSFLSAQLPLVVTIGDISGQPWHNIVLTDVRVDEIHGDTITPFLQIDTLEAGYNWHDLLGGRWRLLSASVAGIEARLGTESDGTLHKPWASSKPKTPPSRFPEFQIEELRLRRVSAARIGADTLRLEFDSLSGSVQLADDRLKIGYAISDLRYDGKLDVYIDTAAGEIVGVGGEWFAENLFVRMDSTEVRGSVRVEKQKPLRLLANLQSPRIRWNDLARFVSAKVDGEGRLAAEVRYDDGHASGRGTVGGRIFGRAVDALAASFDFENNLLRFDTLYGGALGAQVEGRAHLDLGASPIAYGVEAQVEHFNLGELVLDTITTDITGSFEAAGQGVTSDDMRVAVQVDGASGRFMELHIDTASGKLTATADSLYIDSGFAATYNGMNLVAAGALAYEGNISLSGTAAAPSITPMIDALGFPGSTGRATGSFILSDALRDPTLEFEADVDSATYKGATFPAGHVRARLPHAFSNALGTIEASSGPCDLWGTPVDSLKVFTTLLADRFRFEPVRVFRGNDTASLAAEFDPDTDALSVEQLHASLWGKAFSLSNTAEFTVGDDTTWIHHAGIQEEAGLLTANGWISYDRSAHLQIAATDAEIGPWAALLRPADTITGILFAQAEVQGKLDSPLVRYGMRLSGATYNGFLLGEFVSAGKLRSHEAEIDSVILRTPVGQYTAFGTIPLTSDSVLWLPDKTRPIKIHAETQGMGLHLVSMFLPDIESFTGDVHAEADIEGTLSAPSYRGHFQLRNGTVKVWQLVDPFTEVNLRMSLADSVATIEQATAVSKSGDVKGEITASGKMIFRTLTTLDYNLRIEGKNVPVNYELADFEGRFDFSLVGEGYNPPLIYGDVFTHEAYYRDPFEAVDSLELMATEVEIDTTRWDININVEIPKNAWVKNEDVNAELEGDLRILREKGRWNYLGTLDLLRGSYDFLGRKFHNLRGSVIFDDIDQVDPRLNLEADVRLPTVRDTQVVAGTVSGSQREITVKVEGRLSAPKIIPPSWMDERSFIQAINPLGSSASATIGAAGLLTSELEQLGTHRLGVETFELRPSATGGFDPLQTELSIGTYLLSDVYVYGTGEFDLSKGTELGFEYRLKNWLRVQGNRDRSNLYQFDLNFNWEMDK
jgi:hypothetical protein